MNESLSILLVTLVVVLLIGVFIGIPEWKERTSKERYKALLLKECLKELNNPDTILRTHEHKFNWDYQYSKLDAEWRIMTPRFSVTLRGYSEVTRDVENIDGFFNVSKIEYVDIFLGDDNLSVLHTYRTPDDINRLIEGVKTLEKNNKYKSQKDNNYR